VLERLRAQEPALRELHPEPRLGGHQPHRWALIAWAQMICLDGELKKAEPKTIRYRLLHVAATLVRHRRLILGLDETWRWAATLRRAFLRLRTAFP